MNKCSVGWLRSCNGSADNCVMYVKLKVSVILICAIFGIAHGRVDSSIFRCAVDEFLCENGECIDSTSACDGTLHCKDGSDELFSACGFLLGSSAKKLSSIGARIRRALKLERFLPCVVPPQPKNGMRKLNRDYCDGDEDCDVAEGSSLNSGSQLTYACEKGFRLEGHPHVFCAGSGKWSLIPVCKQIKCEALTTASTLAACFRHGNRTNCEEPVLPETAAQVSCQAGYRQDTNSAMSRRDRVRCRNDGKWHPEPIICIPECGVATDRKTPFVLGGNTATVADFPWHATLYQEVHKKGVLVKEFICGATVIHTKLVLTAAHCVYVERTRSTTDPKTLHVATGNVFREFDSPLHDSNVVQKRPVRNVLSYVSYYGLRGNYFGDIALLELQRPFTFSRILMPACLDISGFSRQILEPGSSGRVAGFGVTQSGVASAILQTITVPYVAHSTCRNSRQGSQDEVLISNDKFCAGHINGTRAVCEGDSGGGLVFRKNDLWYVMGIVSVSLGVDSQNGERICETSAYTLYTNVANYIHWIQDMIYNVEVRDGRELEENLEENFSPETTSIARQKCAAYASFILPNSSRTIGDLQCTNNRGPGRIQVPRDAQTNEFPYMTRIGFNMPEGGITWKYSATLISENYVISTARFSQYRYYGLASWVQLGDWNNNQGVEKYISQRRITQIIRHPGFLMYRNDVALYKMDRPVTFDESILPACLYGLPDDDTTNPITVTGLWHHSFQTSSSFNYGLSSMTTRVVDKDTCNASYPDYLPGRIVDESIICVNDSTPMDCSEFGTGSALVLPSNDLRCMKELVGIASDSSWCNLGQPRGYMRVYHYIRWIESIVWPDV